MSANIHSPKHCVIFDFDGTIADTFDWTVENGNKLLKQYGREDISKDQMDLLRTKGIREAFRTLNIPLLFVPYIVKKLQYKLHQDIQSIRCFEGLQGVITDLSIRGYTLGIISSNLEKNVKDFLTNHKLDHYFTFMDCGSGLFGKERRIQKVLKDNNLSSHQVIYIGDEIRDIEACQKAGIPIIAVTWGFNSKEILASHSPNYLADTPKGLLDVLTK